MNNRIQKIAEQAKKYALDAMIKITDKEQALKVYSETYDTKFAELIVQECARLCEHESNDDEYDQYDMGQSVKAESIKTAIKKHFGVEE